LKRWLTAPKNLHRAAWIAACAALAGKALDQVV
jgi:hypothetical protein